MPEKMEKREYEKYKKRIRAAYNAIVTLIDVDAGDKDYGDKQLDYMEMHDELSNALDGLSNASLNLAVLKEEQA
ncbi:hypothetical protein DUK53_14525 [Listeria sp. SHR_NRA_18]|uniref:hypothetical protein n=1 Tax=Listeria TaxID=1637 RepID=UPI000F60232C|nr:MULTISPECIES: hypothetical protein [Listeria]RQW65826.1 hypothetical protein DUK53_14525 [Listeria sp. SHR_NRA_18]WAO22067.1 hypothetical protein OTR81_01880 [Listeria newyorkensis]